MTRISTVSKSNTEGWKFEVVIWDSTTLELRIFYVLDFRTLYKSYKQQQQSPFSNNTMKQFSETTILD